MALVTIDAMGCQTKIAQKIIGKEADCLRAVKENWPALHGEIEHYSANAEAASLDWFETADGEHARIEIRRQTVSRDIE